MRRESCPRCGRWDGIPIEYGLPDDELIAQAKRGEVSIGGCLVFGDAPDFRCVFCRHDWRGGEVPAWAPPRPVDRLDPAQYDAARWHLTERADRTAQVVRALRRGGLAEAQAEVDRVKEWLAAGDIAAGLDNELVPTDCVLLAEVLDAATSCAGRSGW